GYHFLFPGQPLELGRTLELNDHLVRIVGVAEASAPFATFPVMFARYSQAITFVGSERNQRFCRKVRFLGQNPKVGCQEFNELQTPKLSKKQLCDRTRRPSTGKPVSCIVAIA